MAPEKDKKIVLTILISVIMLVCWVGTDPRCESNAIHNNIKTVMRFKYSCMMKADQNNANDLLKQ